VSFYDVVTFPFWIVQKRNSLIILLVILFIIRTRGFVSDGKVSEGRHFICFVLQAKVTRNSCEPAGVNLLEKYAVNIRSTTVVFKSYDTTSTEHNTTILSSLHTAL